MPGEGKSNTGAEKDCNVDGLFWTVGCKKADGEKAILAQLFKKKGCAEADQLTPLDPEWPTNKYDFPLASTDDSDLVLSANAGDGKCHTDVNGKESSKYEGCTFEDSGVSLSPSVTLVVSAVALMASIFV